jgi:di/tricarboxylate transporter
MTLPQALSFAVIALMMAAFVWGRFRYDVVAVGALLAAVATGIVAPQDAFAGFSDDIVIIVGSALMVSGAISRSGVMEAAVQRFAPDVTAPRAQLLILVVTVAVLSAFVKNVGALAIMMPIAIQMARRAGVSPSLYLMPMAFGSLLGGLTTQIGTSPNVIVSRLRGEMTGTPFSMFDFTAVGATLALVGVVFLAFGYRLLPDRRSAEAGLNEAIEIKNYTTEARVTKDSTVIGKTVREVEKLAGADVMITAIVGAAGRRRTPFPDAAIAEGDVLMIEGEPKALDSMVAHGKLKLTSDKGDVSGKIELGTVEAIVRPTSGFVGMTAQRLALSRRTGLTLLAVSRRGERFTERLNRITLAAGDVILLQGDRNRLPELLRDWDCLPLAERELNLGIDRKKLVPVGILVVAVLATTLGLAPVQVAFFAAAAAMVASGALPAREAYHHLDAPILVMLAALIPVSDSVRTTGGTDLIAGWLSQAAHLLPPYGALALILVAAMAVTPFLNNAATVLVMAPIAAQFATALHYKPEAFLMAVAIGAGCDFLTPIGHQCNTLVMGPGGYRYGDYARLGAPLSLLVVVVGVPALLLAWPIH